jgi:uncharacterized membrane protein YuzA (DUF378 family)
MLCSLSVVIITDIDLASVLLAVLCAGNAGAMGFSFIVVRGINGRSARLSLSSLMLSLTSVDALMLC